MKREGKHVGEQDQIHAVAIKRKPNSFIHEEIKTEETNKQKKSTKQTTN